MGAIEIALGLAQFVPQIVKWVTGSDKDKAVAEKIVGIAQQVTGHDDPLAAVAADPALALQLRQELDRHDEELARIAANAALEQRKLDQAERETDSRDMAAVNATMQLELQGSAGEAWYQKAWRPFNGFVVALGSLLAVIFVCGLFWQAIAHPTPDTNVASVINVIPQLATAIATILVIPGAAVGIASWHRGVAKVRSIGGGN